MEYTVKEIICSDGGKATVYIPIRTEEEEKKQQECIAKAGASLLRAALAAEMKQQKVTGKEGEYGKEQSYRGSQDLVV